MLPCDESVIQIAQIIDENIKTIKRDSSYRDLASTNVLSHLRNLIEHVFLQIYCHNREPNYQGPEGEYGKIYDSAIPYVKAIPQYHDLVDFHKLLKKTNSHYSTSIEEGSRLLLHYLAYLVLIQNFEKKTYGISIIPNLESYPQNLDSGQKGFYESVAKAIIQSRKEAFSKEIQPYYVTNKRLIRVGDPIFYEVTLIPANDFSDKFNQITVFTEENIMTQFAIEAEFFHAKVILLEKKVEVLLLRRYKPSIRPSELEKLAKIVGINELRITRSERPYIALMDFLKEERLGLNDLLSFSQKELKSVLEDLFPRAGKLYDFFLRAQDFVTSKQLGWKTFLYLAACPRNAVIKKQLPFELCRLENTSFHLSKRCYSFERAPFSASLVKHNPSLAVLTRCFDQNAHKEELFARQIKLASLYSHDIFVPEDEVEHFGEDFARLLSDYNSKVSQPMRIGRFAKHLFINEVLNSTKDIIDLLSLRIGKGVAGYENVAQNYYASLSDDQRDDPDKKTAFKTLFSANGVAFLYGPAGTGKTTFISHICRMFDSIPKIVATQTKSTLDHLRRACNSNNTSFFTLSKLKGSMSRIKCRLFIVDECSASDNRTMAEVLKKMDCETMLFAGDTEQLEPINFGNWFVFAKGFFAKKNAVFELTNKFRTSDKALLEFWDAVRKRESEAKIGAIINRNRFSSKINKSVFDRFSDDEITLCLNYDGIFGINNINSYLQASNPNDSIVWGHKTYKIGDPILFIDNSRFHETLYNNLKGRILDIGVSLEKIVFTIEVDRILSSLDMPLESELELIESKPQSSIVQFPVYPWQDSHDEDARAPFSIVPFQVAYAVSIHKAQGLEYDSVKIVIDNSVEDRITLNVFYTAITRSKRFLRVYWSPESEKTILASLFSTNHSKDAKLFQNYFKTDP